MHGISVCLVWAGFANSSLIQLIAFDADKKTTLPIYRCSPRCGIFQNWVPMERCDLCDRCFADPEALQQHIRDSITHTIPFRCEPCNRSFKSQEALDQHSRDSPSHAISYDCGPCNRSFGSQNALDQHIQYSSVHIAPPTTPLDAFFLSFTAFEYDPDLPPSESFAQLKRFYGWRRGDPDDRQAWIGYQAALEEEVRLWFGAEDDLSAWHSVCRAIGIEPLPATCSRSKKVRTHLASIIWHEYSRCQINT